MAGKSDELLRRFNGTLNAMLAALEELPEPSLRDIAGNGAGAAQTALIVVDMINGFAREGALKSPRVAALAAEIARLSEACGRLGIVKLAFADCHSGASPEFDSYPRHCVKGSTECELVPELKAAGSYKIVEKNSTNGFLEPEFQEWLRNNGSISNFIVVGDCTDICIEQFSTTLKAHFNRLDRRVRVIVPLNAVDTFDLGLHDAELLNLVSLFMMRGSGVEIVKGII